MRRISLMFGERSYSVIISSGLFNDPTSFSPLKKGDKVMLITNQTLAALYLNKVQSILNRVGVKVDNFILPDGEKYKNLTILDKVFTALLSKMHGRDTTLVALGGGVIGDLTGFIAAIYQRGVRFIQVPTTLLSQVDSSVGGKTAINHSLGKNMIGAFYQPASVIIDIDCLKTLPARELASGFAEVIKYGIILDEKFFSWVEENIDALVNLDNRAIEYCIQRCCELKASVVTIDERENSLRTLLNFGHTYAHTIETKMGYGNWLHGEAVSIGMIMAARTSERIGKFTKEETQRIITLLKRAGLPVIGPSEISAKDYLPYIMRDKKVLSGKIRLVLPLAIGKSEIQSDISESDILSAITDCQ